jgi:hypothetical protein
VDGLPLVKVNFGARMAPILLSIAAFVTGHDLDAMYDRHECTSMVWKNTHICGPEVEMDLRWWMGKFELDINSHNLLLNIILLFNA